MSKFWSPAHLPDTFVNLDYVIHGFISQEADERWVIDLQMSAEDSATGEKHHEFVYPNKTTAWADFRRIKAAGAID